MSFILVQKTCTNQIQIIELFKNFVLDVAIKQHMPQSIFIQVGQCGNQIGYRFWDLALQENQLYQKFKNEQSNFFKLSKSSKKTSLQSKESIKARAIMIDMEEGVVSRIMHGPLQHLFDRTQLVTDVSGSGNNWAVGNKFYGLKYQNKLKELFRKEAEECDNLQCFFLIHSLGGGTGSGLGTAVLEYLCDDFPKVPKFVFSAFPSYQDDVITSPYNALLANGQLINFADCVIPFDNKALTEMCNKFIRCSSTKSSNSCVKTHTNKRNTKAFDEMNDIVANAILNLTCSSRFPGSLNIDINEIVMNMTPYPHLHYLVPSVSPIHYFEDMRQKMDDMFSEAFSLDHHLFQCPMKDGVWLACALMCRGQVTMSDVLQNIERLKGHKRFVPWNEEGWKIGLCDVPHLSSYHSLLMLSNTSSITHPLNLLKCNFLKMYHKKAHLHHFLEVESMEKDTFQSCLGDLKSVIEEYKSLEQYSQSLEIPRLKVL